MMRLLLYLVIFLTSCCCICVSEMNVTEIRHARYDKCNKNFTEFNLYSFVKNKFSHKDLAGKQNATRYRADAILTCLCRETYDPIFYISPKFVNESFEDIYFLCLLGNPKSIGMYDDYEVYDKLLYEHVKTIPNTLMTPFLDAENNILEDDDACLDQDGFPTKSIANQRTCFLAVKRNDTGTNEVFSGPLIYSELSNFASNVSSEFYRNIPSCYTSVKNTTFNTDDHCIYSPSDSLFLCCCAKEPKNCRNKKDSKEKQKKLFCAPPELVINYNVNTSDSNVVFPMQKYFDEDVNYACGINISTVASDGQSKFEFHVNYHALNVCSSETPIVDISKSKFCAFPNIPETIKPQNITIKRCCKYGHFCNIDLTPAKKPIKNRCAYKPDVSLYFDESNSCEIYHNITDGKQVYLHENFTTKIIHRTRIDQKYVKNHNGSPLSEIDYLCYYIYAQIINDDSKICSTPVYTANISKMPFYYCTCLITNCDEYSRPVFPKELKFNCQNLNQTDLKNAKNVVEINSTDKWICFVQIRFRNEGSQIEAGHLEINSPFMKHCIEEGVYESDFCCVNIVITEQSETDCTVAKQIKKYNNSRNNLQPNNPGSRNSIKTHGTDLEHIHCYSKDISNSESEHCPKTDGCFSTRILRPSEITSTNAFEPAGCLGYAEKYTVENLPLTSLSLGCRVDENSNRCSIVQTPEGEQRIVCCCNENDQNGLCNTNLNKVPQIIGKNISSFKSLY